MRRIAFFDIDTQFDFMSVQGRLYVEGAEEITPRLKKLTRFADRVNIPIFSSLDLHRDNDREFKLFPRHCVKNTYGAGKIKETIAKKTKQVFIHKATFDVFSNPQTKKIIKKFQRVYIYGVALDYCVRAACLGLARLGIETYLVRDATRAVSAKGRNETLRLLRSKGIKVITTKRLLAQEGVNHGR